MSKVIVFDTGPLISFSLNSLLFLLRKLKGKFNGEFLISRSIKREAVDNPLNSKRFKLEAIQLFNEMHENTLRLYEKDDLKDETENLLDIANNIYRAHDNNIKILHYAETEALALYLKLNADALVIDEFVTRALIEDPTRIKKRLEKKLHTKVSVDTGNIKNFQGKVKGVNVLRSVELITVGFELGLLDEYKILEKDPEKNLLDAVLWGAKLNGCSITEKEIKKIMSIEGF